MEFLTKLIETQESKDARKATESFFDQPLGFRRYPGIPMPNNITLSIQACAGNYCSPRVLLESLADYNSMEIALLNEQQEFISVTDALPTFSRLAEIESHQDIVYGYVPVDLIEDLYQELKAM